MAVEARNHLYAVLKDTEAWQEALQCGDTSSPHTIHRLLKHPGWKESRLVEESQRASKDRAMLEEKGIASNSTTLSDAELSFF